MNSWTLINLNLEKQDHWMEKSKEEWNGLILTSSLLW